MEASNGNVVKTVYNSNHLWRHRWQVLGRRKGKSLGSPERRRHLEDSDARLVAYNGDVVETVWTTLITFGDTCGTPTPPRAVPAAQRGSTRPREGMPRQGTASEVYARNERLPCVEFGPPASI